MDLRLLAPTDAPIFCMATRRHPRTHPSSLSKKSSTYRRTSTSTDPVQEALDMLLDPVAQNNAQGRKPHGFFCLHVDDLFMAGGKVFADKEGVS